MSTLCSRFRSNQASAEPLLCIGHCTRLRGENAKEPGTVRGALQTPDAALEYVQQARSGHKGGRSGHFPQGKGQTALERLPNTWVVVGLGSKAVEAFTV